METADLDNRFKFHPANVDTGKIHDQIRDLHRDVAHKLNFLLDDGREKSLAITKLEESMMWANASVARATGAES